MIWASGEAPDATRKFPLPLWERVRVRGKHRIKNNYVRISSSGYFRIVNNNRISGIRKSMIKIITTQVKSRLLGCGNSYPQMGQRWLSLGTPTAQLGHSFFISFSLRVYRGLIHQARFDFRTNPTSPYKKNLCRVCQLRHQLSFLPSIHHRLPFERDILWIYMPPEVFHRRPTD